MMIDRTTKALLFAIALGLWGSLLSEWVKPVPVQAEQLSGHVGARATGRQTTNDLADIAKYMRQLATGTCSNAKLC